MRTMSMRPAVWYDMAVIRWTAQMLDSYRNWTGRELIEDRTSLLVDAERLFGNAAVVVSHGLGDDPILNYGNVAAQRLWGLDWENLIQMPSSLTAEPVERAKRRQMLDEAARRGCIQNYEGIRVTADGRRLRIYDGVIWNVLDRQGQFLGQAATFPRWTFLQP